MKIISWKLWFSSRDFPLVPVVSLGSFLSVVLLGLFFIIAACIFVKPTNSYFLFSLLITEFIAMLGDEIRWQPWLYQFLFIAFAVLANKKRPNFAINCIILILASTYFFSGLQKINAGFLQSVWLRLVLVRFLHFSNTVYSSRSLRYAGLIVPLFEMLSGVLLLLPRQYKIFALLPIAMHLFVLVFIGPFGIHYNMIVLPWNVAMAICIYVIFIKNQAAFSFTDMMYKWNLAIAFVWMALPVAGVFGYWDKFFSSSVYSGNNHHLEIFIANTSAVAPELLPYVSYSKNGFHGIHAYINVHDWCLAELNVPVPPEKRIYESIETSFLKKYGDLQPVFDYR